jgi:hypothetical protein
VVACGDLAILSLMQPQAPVRGPKKVPAERKVEGQAAQVHVAQRSTAAGSVKRGIAADCILLPLSHFQLRFLSAA